MRLYEFLEKHPQYESDVKDHLTKLEFEQAMRAKQLSSLTLHGLVFVDAPEDLSGSVSIKRSEIGRSTNLEIKPAP